MSVTSRSGSSAEANGLIGSVFSLLRATLQNIGLIRELVIRDLRGAHARHGFGAYWVFIQPLVIVTSYVLVFGLVLGAKLTMTESFPGDYTSYVLVGIVPWLLMQNGLGRGSGIFIANANLVKQVVFPIEVLPVANAVASFLTFVPAFGVMILYKLVLGGGLSWTFLLLPLALALQFAVALGAMLVLSILTPFVRDIRELVTVYLSVSVYFTPAVYLPDWVPSVLRPVIYMNPFSYLVWMWQDVLFFGRIEHPAAWAVVAAMAGVGLVAGASVFSRLRPYLGNVI